MTKEQTIKLRGYYKALRGQLRVLEQKPNDFVTHRTVFDVIKRTFDDLQQDFPGLMPRLEAEELKYNNSHYLSPSLRAQVATAIGLLESQLEEGVDGSVINQLLFAFLHDAEVRRIVERDYVEIQRAFIAQCWKSVIVLAGGAIEAIMLDLLIQKETSAKAASAAPNKNDLGRWDFADLINVAVELRLVTPGVSKLSHPLGEFRNLVHASYEVRNSLIFGREEAVIAIEILNMLHRDLSP